MIRMGEGIRFCRKLTKRAIAFALSTRVERTFRTMVVASTGRSGSTLIFDSLRASYVRAHANALGHRLPDLMSRVIGGYKDRIQTFSISDEMILKTHDLYRNAQAKEVKYIFIYGDPLEAVASVDNMVQRKGREWFYLHQRHLLGSGSYQDRFKSDVLNFEGQMRSWLCQRNPDILVLKYEDIWERKAEIAEFIGMELLLPEKRPRTPASMTEPIDEELFDWLRALADDLYHRVGT